MSPASNQGALGWKVVFVSAAGLVAGVVIGAAYGLLVAICPIVYANVALTFICGSLLGAVVAWLSRNVRLRGRRIILPVATLTTVAGYYASWIAWESFIFSTSKQSVTVGWLLMHPAGVWRGVTIAYQYGTWSVFPHLGAAAIASLADAAPTVDGPLLVIVWLGEAVVIFVISFFASGALDQDRPYCERCNRRCAESKLIHSYSNETDPLDIKLLVEAGDFEPLGTLAMPRYGEPVRLRLEHFSCGGCDETHLLTLKRVKIASPGAQKAKDEVTVLHEEIPITAEQVAALKATPPVLIE